MALKFNGYKKYFLIKTLIFSVCFLSAIETRAQNESVPETDSLKNSFFAGAGMATPLGNFGSTDFNIPAAGYAKTGYGAEVGYSYRLMKGFCIKANLSMMRNTINNTMLASQAKQFTETQTGFSNLFASSSESYWQNYFLHAGFSYQLWFGANKKIGLEPEVLAGADYCITPYVEYNVRIENLTFQTRNAPKGNFAFSHRESIKINYLLGNRTIAFFNLGYCGAMANAGGLERIVIGNNTYTKTTNDYKINLGVILIGIGITTRF